MTRSGFHAGFAVATVLLGAMPPAGHAADAAFGAVEEHWQVRADAENWRLPGDESMGAVRLALRHRLGDWFAAGIDGSAAVRGSRGGFITLGVGAEAFLPISAHVGAEAGLSIQAGGGRGGYQLSGGGLMTRALLGLRYLGPGADSVSVGLSRVDFPAGGTIRSNQLYVAYTHAFDGWSLAPGADAAAIAPGALGSMADRIAVTAEPLWIDHGIGTLGAGPQRNLGLVGVEWQAGLGGGWYARLAAAGAASGSSSGYMQVLGGLGYRWPLTRSLTLTAAASTGAGGGGAVDTGGGLLLEGEAGVSVAFGSRDSLDLTASRLRAPSGAFGARGLTARIAHRFGPDDRADAAAPSRTEVHSVRVRIVDQEYRAASAAWSARSNPSFGTMGVQVDYFTAPSWYLTGQGLAAARGQNGAYMIGLMGGGWRHEFTAALHLELEALAGAAGGGGVAVGSGIVAQANLGLGYDGPHGLGIRTGIGRLQSRRGGFSANVAEVAVTYRTRLLSAAD